MKIDMFLFLFIYFLSIIYTSCVCVCVCVTKTERYQQMIHVMIVSQSAEESRVAGIAKENSRPQYLLIPFFWKIEIKYYFIIFKEFLTSYKSNDYGFLFLSGFFLSNIMFICCVFGLFLFYLILASFFLFFFFLV